MLLLLLAVRYLVRGPATACRQGRDDGVITDQVDCYDTGDRSCGLELVALQLVDDWVTPTACCGMECGGLQASTTGKYR